MTTALLVLAGVALLVRLSITRPALPPHWLFGAAPADRDRERQLAELRAYPASRADVRIP